jgi:hypothetical protein
MIPILQVLDILSHNEKVRIRNEREQRLRSLTTEQLQRELLIAKLLNPSK